MPAVLLKERNDLYFCYCQQTDPTSHFLRSKTLQTAHKIQDTFLIDCMMNELLAVECSARLPCCKDKGHHNLYLLLLSKLL